jgi:hypothetical protein
MNRFQRTPLVAALAMAGLAQAGAPAPTQLPTGGSVVAGTASIASTGWSRKQVREFLFKAMSRKRSELVIGGMYGMRDWPPEINNLPMDALIAPVPTPDDILVMVVGGTGKHSAALPSFGPTVSVTRLIPGR